MVIAVDAVEETAALPDRLSGTSRTSVIDRWIYVFTAASLIAVVFAGFIPDSFTKMAAIDAGKRPPFPLILHVHAALMGSFLLLLLSQTILVATGRRNWHRQLGIAGAFVAAAIIISGFVLVPTMYSNAPVQDDILLLQLRAGLLFSIFMWIALRARTRDVGLHKRMMFLAITAVLGAAIVRIGWLPTTFPKSALTLDFFTLLPLAPMLVWDFLRNRSLHRAYFIWAILYLPVTALVYVVWNTPWWHAAAHKLMGV
jgi:hypothetical protein